MIPRSCRQSLDLVRRWLGYRHALLHCERHKPLRGHMLEHLKSFTRKLPFIQAVQLSRTDLIAEIRFARVPRSRRS